MSLKEQIYSVLVVSTSNSFNSALSSILPTMKYQPIKIVGNISEAKRYLLVRTYDFVIINSPLPDESGARFAIDTSHTKNIVTLLFVSSDLHTEVHDRVAEHGVFTLPKPTTRATLLQALSWMESVRERLRMLEQKSSPIEEKMEEIRLINRAKLLLISQLQMSEDEAHRYLGKYAMDNCISRRAAAENLIKLYG